MKKPARQKPPSQRPRTAAQKSRILNPSPSVGSAPASVRSSEPPPPPPPSGFEPENFPRQPYVSPPVDLIYLYSVLRSGARFIVGTTVLSMFAMLVYLQFAAPQYTAYSQLMLDTRQELAAPVEGVVSSLDLTQSALAGEVITIRSNVLLGRVVDTLDLVNDPAFDPRMPRAESLFSQAKRVLRGSTELPHEFAARMPMETLRSWVVADLRRNLNVSQLGVSYVIGINYQGPDPRMAAAIANTVAQEYIQSQLSSKAEATMRANDWMSARLGELSVQVQGDDQSVVNFQAEMIRSANGNSVSINQLLAELNTLLVRTAAERADVEVRLREVEGLLERGGLAMVADVVTSPLQDTLQRQHAELAATQARLASTFGVRHPEMVRIAAQINDINRSIDGEVRRRLDAMRSEVTVIRNREVALQAQIAEVSERADLLAMSSVRLRQLERSADATRLVYESFLSRFQETTAQADFQIPEARIIGSADVPAVPSGPRRTLFMLVATVFGATAAVAIVFLRNLVRSPVRTTGELVSLTRVNNLTTLPYVRKYFGGYRWLRKHLSGDGNTSYMEHVRVIRTALFDMTRSRKPKVIVITSAAPNEGKTSLGCALARTLSRPGKSVLLIDADLRRPDVRKILAMEQEGRCLSSYLRGTTDNGDLAMRSDLIGADVISATQRSQDAADLLLSPRFNALVKQMSGRYDHVVVNAPPVLHLADALLLAEYSDATLFAVRCGKTRSKTVRSSIQRLKEVDGPLVCTVMTMVRQTDMAAREAENLDFAY